MATKTFGLFVAGCFVGLCAQAQTTADPLSAIDWLSNSVNDPVPETTVTGPESPARVPADIVVLPLDAPVFDQVGLVDAGELGLPNNLWGQSSSGDLAMALAQIELGPDTPPSIRKTMVDILTARLDPPIDAAIDQRFFRARVDQLLAKGHLKAANDLIAAVGESDAQLFRRRFDIALLTGTENEACREIESTPELSPTYPARIFCLARLGNFDVAALTLGNAETLGILNKDEDALLLRFLDPELFEDEPLPRAPALPTPLQFRLYEAVGERIATDQLPVAFATVDLANTVGWKARLTAVERLAETRAASFEDLLAIFSEEGAAASGGIWDRVRAMQTLSKAVAEGEANAIEAALPDAWFAAGNKGYQAAMADWVLPELEGLNRNGAVAHLAFEIAMIAEDLGLAAEFASNSPEDRFLLSILSDRAGSEPATDALGRAILRGLSSLNAGASYDALIRERRTGEVLFRALDQLSDGAGGNPDSTANSIAALRKIGLGSLAQQISVELILKEGAA